MSTRQCATCHVIKPLEEFNRRRSASDGRQPRCRDCCKAWYRDNAEAQKKNVRARNERMLDIYRKWICDYLAEHPCVDCGERDIRVLEFDHRDPAQKSGNVCTLAFSLTAWTRVLEEIATCDVRCTNRHRRRTNAMGGWYRVAVQAAIEQAVLTAALARLARVIPAQG